MAHVSAEGPVGGSRTPAGAAAALALGVTAWTAASVLAMTYGTQLNWPDYVHVDFGFPMTFATHTLNTIAGEADRWAVDLGALTLDLFFWLGGMAVIFLAGFWYHEGRRRKGEAALPSRESGARHAPAVARETRTEALPGQQTSPAGRPDGE